MFKRVHRHIYQKGYARSPNSQVKMATKRNLNFMVDGFEYENEADDCIWPCLVEPLHRVYGPEAYEEFEACLNGSGITIRVLRATHKLVNTSSEVKQSCERDEKNSIQDCIDDYLMDEKSKSCKRRAMKHSASVPNVRANIKYSNERASCVESYRVPFTKIKNICTTDNRDVYRKPGAGDCENKSTELRHTRSCCLQVDPVEIQNILENINADAKKKGIEVCYKNCNDADSDVFVVKLGSKNACEHKKRSVEVELKTPKMPIICPIAKYTTETQTVQNELDKTREVMKLPKKGKKQK